MVRATRDLDNIFVVAGISYLHYKERDLRELADFLREGLVLGEFEDKFEQFMLQQVREMILYAGEPRYLLYGTDWPICSMKSYLKFIRGLGPPEKSLELILWRNAARLFKIDVV